MSIPEDDRGELVKDLDLDKKGPQIESALGIWWNRENDTFNFKISVPMTRRGILSMLNSVYDPLGFLALPETILQSWKQWLVELDKLCILQIQRCTKPDHFDPIKASQLHHFCDASEVGYGTVSYLRYVNDRNEIHVSFIMGKARVAPLKEITISRLELQAATLGFKDG